VLGIFLFSTGCASAYAAPLVGTTPGIGAHVDVATRPASAAIAAKASQYVVQPGDTLWGIAERYPGVSVEDLKRLNTDVGDDLKPGSRIKVRAPKG
jgi:membrane-bound lytic murein transglycosylase D